MHNTAYIFTTSAMANEHNITEILFQFNDPCFLSYFETYLVGVWKLGKFKNNILVT